MSGVFRFADFELLLQQRLLLQHGQPIHTGGRALDLLALLVTQCHRIVSKAELIDHCWPDQAVEPNNLAVQVWALRRLLGPGVIATVPGRGYQFTATVHSVPAASSATVASALPAIAAAKQLPRPAPHLPVMFGRSADLALLQSLLKQHRLVTLLGPPGVGKSRLAQAMLEAALELPAMLVDLASVHDADADGVARAVRAALGLADSPVTRPASPAQLAWMGLLPSQPLLLVLDNCAHQAAATAALASALLMQAPALRLLVTSLHPLGLPMEQQMRLQPLPVASVHGSAGDGGRIALADKRTAPLHDHPALQLLLSRIQSQQPRFQLVPADLPLALQLCRRLDGLPLAIELAAARVPALGLAGVLARLDDQLRLLHRDVPADRHASLGVALAWAVSLLPAPLQRLFQSLGVFQGSFSTDLAVLVCKGDEPDDLDSWAVIDGLAQLVEHSLLLVEPADDTAATHRAGELPALEAAPRLRLLDSARAHAQQRLQAGGKLLRMQQRLAEAVHSMLARDARAREQGQLSDDTALYRVRVDLAHVRAAMAWVLADPSRAAIGHAITAHAWPAMLFIGLHHEAMQWMQALLPLLADDTPPHTAGYFLLGMGRLGLGPGLMVPAQRHAVLLRAQAQLDTLGRPEFAMAARQTLAQSACQLGEAAQALVAIDQALAMMPPIAPANHQAYQADLLAWQGTALALLGRLAEARHAHAQALPLCVAGGNQDFLFLLECDLARLELLLGLHAQAAGRWQFLTEAATARGVHSHVAAPLWAGLQASLLALGDAAGARAAAQHSWRHMAALGSPLEGCLLHAWLLALEGRAQAALQLLGAGDRQLRLAGETRLPFEPAARGQVLACLGAQALTPDGEGWRRHGETLTPDGIAALLFPAAAAAATAGQTRDDATPPPTLHLLLVDDHPLFREGLALALQQALPGVQVLACGTPAEAQALLAAQPGATDLVLVDHRLAGGASGLDWARQLRRSQPALAVALLSGDDDTSLPARARQAGLVAFLPKTLDVPALAQVLQALQAGDTWFPPAAGSAPITQPTGLTERQHQIVQLAAQGANSKAIGHALGISPASVRNHFAQIFERLGARSGAHAVQLLQRADGPDPPEPS